MDNLLKIGEVAKLFHISVGSLRHYEAEGVLVPEYIDKETGYRYYSTRQFEVLNTILYLRVLDMPLTQIADFIKNKDVDVMEEKLKRQKEIVHEKLHQLQIIERKIDNRLNRLYEARSFELDKINIIKTRAQRMARLNDSVKIKSHLDLENSIRLLERKQNQTVVFLGKVGVGISKEHLNAEEYGQYDFIFLMLDDEDDFSGSVEVIPPEECVAVGFRGSHERAAEQYKRLKSFIDKNNFLIAGDSREITIIDYGMTLDKEKYVTEIQIPVVRSGELK